MFETRAQWTGGKARLRTRGPAPISGAALSCDLGVGLPEQMQNENHREVCAAHRTYAKNVLVYLLGKC